MVNIRSLLAPVLATSLTTFLFATPALAAGSNMPWESSLSDIATSVSGPVLAALGVLVICGVAGAVSLGDSTSGVRRGLMAVVGIGIAASATTLLSWLGFAGGALVP